MLSPFFQQQLHSRTSGSFHPEMPLLTARQPGLCPAGLRPLSVSSMLDKPPPLSPLAGRSDAKQTLTLFWGTSYAAETYSVFSLFSNILTFCTVVTGRGFLSLFCGVFHPWGRSGCCPVRGGTRTRQGVPPHGGRRGNHDWPLKELGLGSPLVAIPHHCWLSLSQVRLPPARINVPSSPPSRPCSWASACVTWRGGLP